MNKFKNLKIAVVHDHLGWAGGGERTALIMALGLKADFLTIYSNPETFPEYQKELGSCLKVLTKRILDKEVIRYFWLRGVFWLRRKEFDQYDVLIASGQAAVEAITKYGKKGAKRILYCHTPPRRVYDLYEMSRKNYKWFLRPLFTVFTKYWDWTYRQSLKKIDYIIANSENINNRLRKYTGFAAQEVIWPPILTNNFKYLEDGDYFISWGRLDEAKRIEIIVEAFQKMPEKKLIVASGGPRLAKIRKMVEGFHNITVLGWVNDGELYELVGKSLAAIYIPIDEDAGITHLEANAAGKMIIGVREGGLKETIIEGETGFMVKENPGSDDLVDLIKSINPSILEEKREVCINHAEQYNRERFEERVREVVEMVCYPQ